MTRVRRSQEERRRDTQQAVLDAVIELLLERGYAKMTAADVAARAGVSRGAQSHYFRTKLDLTIAAAQRAMAASLELAESMAETAIRSDDPLGVFIAQSRRFFLEPRYVAMIEILLVARTDLPLSKEFSELILTTRQRMESIWLSVFKHAGLSDELAYAVLIMTHHLMRGMAMSTLWRSEPREMEDIIARWTTMAHGLLEAERLAKTHASMRRLNRP